MSKGRGRDRYRWVIVFAGAIGLLASLGIGRFSLGMMLPKMGESLGLSYTQMGLISTVNFCGYLGAVLLCGRLTAMFGARLLIFLALLMVGGSMQLIGKTTGYPLIVFLYCITGIGSALSNVPIMALISTWFSPAERGRAAGLCVMGNGTGLLLSGKLVPLLNRQSGDWNSGWLVLGGLAMVIGFLCLVLIRNNPESVDNRSPEGVGGMGHLLRGSSRRRILHCAGIYFLFGLTYVVYITFLVTSLVQDRGLTEQEAGELWSWVGVISLGSGPIFGYISDRFGRRAGLMLVFGIQSLAYLLVGLPLSLEWIYLSGMLFGLVAWAVPSIMAALVGDLLGAWNAAAGFGLITFVFGIGQIAGPYLAGIAAQASGGFGSSFLAASLCTGLAVLASKRLPPA